MNPHGRERQPRPGERMCYVTAWQHVVATVGRSHPAVQGAPVTAPLVVAQILRRGPPRLPGPITGVCAGVALCSPVFRRYFRCQMHASVVFRVRKGSSVSARLLARGSGFWSI